MRLLPVLLLLGCSPAVRAQMKERRDMRTLGEAATEYWTALRWNDPATAAAFLETPEQRLRLGRLVAEPTVRLTDVAVLNIVVGEDRKDDPTGIRRDGVAVVRIESYDIRGGAVDVATVEQHWQRDALGWKVDADKSPLSLDRPW